MALSEPVSIKPVSSKLAASPAPESSAPAGAAERRAAIIGALSAGGAFLIWGLSPAYWKTLKAVPAFEILMHRIVWSFIFLMPILLLRGGWKDFTGVLRNRRTLSILLLTTVIVAGNWFTFIWAINSDHILQTSLGYYINPLVNVFLGVFFLGEGLRPPQKAAVGLAAAGVAYMTLGAGQFPFVALFLAFTFAVYGLIRKIAPVSALVGLTVETLLLSAPALIYLIHLEVEGRGAFFHMGPRVSLLLMGSALVTGLPLLMFTFGARLIHFTTVGFMQYLAPSCSFLLAVFVFGEALSAGQLITFGFIWTALLIYSVDSIRHFGNGRKAAKSAKAGAPAAPLASPGLKVAPEPKEVPELKEVPGPKEAPGLAPAPAISVIRPRR